MDTLIFYDIWYNELIKSKSSIQFFHKYLFIRSLNYVLYNREIVNKKSKIIYKFTTNQKKKMRLPFIKGCCVWRITSDAKGYTLSSFNLIALKLGLKQMRWGVSSGFICVYTFYLLIYNIAICKSIYIYVYMYTQTTLYLMIRRSNNSTVLRSCNGVYNI